MTKLITIILTAILFSGCQPNETSEEISENDTTHTELDTMNSTVQPLKFLALGDSYTIGESVLESERWPVQLTSKLGANGIEIEKPTIIAKTGWTTDELQSAIDKENPVKNYDLVSLLIGVNNQYRGYNIEQYESEFKQLLLQAVEFAGNNNDRIFVVSIPDYSVTPFAQNRDTAQISKEIDQYNAIAKEIANAQNIRFFNITPISRKAKNDSELIAGDGLHPSAKMYAEWVDLIALDVKNMLNH